LKIRILQSAFDDLDRGAAFYERQAEGLGSYFISSLMADIDSLVLYAGIHRVVRGYHRQLSKRFPYAIYYRLETDCAVVHAVLDCRRRPGWIALQLRRRK
jgi:hypothetical protein